MKCTGTRKELEDGCSIELLWLDATDHRGDIRFTLLNPSGTLGDTTQRDDATIYMIRVLPGLWLRELMPLTSTAPTLSGRPW